MATLSAIKVWTMTDLAEMIQQGMNDKGIPLRDLARKVGISYEYMRMIARGERIPQKVTLISICRVLEVDCDEALRLSIMLRMQATPDSVIAALPTELKQIAESWEFLTDAQRKYILQAVINYAGVERQKEI